MEPDQVVREFTHQSESFNVAPVMRSADTLGRLVDRARAAGTESPTTVRRPGAPPA